MPVDLEHFTLTREEQFEVLAEVVDEAQDSWPQHALVLPISEEDRDNVLEDFADKILARIAGAPPPYFVPYPPILPTQSVPEAPGEQSGQALDGDPSQLSSNVYEDTSDSQSEGPEVDFFAPSRSPTPPPGTLVHPGSPDLITLVLLNLPHMSYEAETREWEEDIRHKKRRTFTPGVEGSALADMSRNRWGWDGQGRLMYVQYSVEIAYSDWLSRLAGRSHVWRSQPSPFTTSRNRWYFPGFGPRP